MKWVKLGLAVIAGSVTVVATLVTTTLGVVALGGLWVSQRPDAREWTRDWLREQRPGGAAWVLEQIPPERLQELATQLASDPASHGLYVERGIERCYPTARGDLSTLPPELQALGPTTVEVNGHEVQLQWLNDRTYRSGYTLRLLTPGADESWLRSSTNDGYVRRELHPRVWACYQR